MNRMEKAKSNFLDLPCFLNLANHVNPVYSFPVLFMTHS
jgi:hypothetical protein